VSEFAAVTMAALSVLCLGAKPAEARLGRVTSGPPGPPRVDMWRLPVTPTSVVRRLRDPWRRTEAARRRAAVVELCAGFAAELGAGGSARDALVSASRDVPDVAHIAGVASAPHGDVAAALRATAALDGGAGLHRLAMCWQVSERSGSSLAPAVARLTATLRDEEQVRREVAAQLAGPRATAVLLALLPLFGLSMGSALGADPLAVLLGTPIGRGCLAVGVLLEAIGLLWTARITRRAEQT